MSDTIDLLESIGRDASLRHATAHELAAVLEQADADPALRSAVASGDVSALKARSGRAFMHTTQVTQHPGDHEHEHEPPGEHDHPGHHEHPDHPRRDEPHREPAHDPAKKLN